MEYTALDTSSRQIRLLYLHPGEQDEELECHLSAVSLDNIHADYEALSYVWGESVERRIVYLEGRKIPITDNLWQALKALRRLDNERVIWVDALCIDQFNNEERSGQVALMHSVFARASSVEIWLSESFPDIGLALQFFQDFASDICQTGSVRSYASPGLIDDDFDEDTLAGDAKGSFQTLMAIDQIFQSHWWSRTWTAQEFVLAKEANFHCGPYTFDGATLVKCAWHVERHERSDCTCGLPLDWSKLLEYMFDPFYELLRLQSSRLSFLECVGQLRLRNASDPRDKIYGLLALPEHEKPDAVRPDYSLSVDKIYESFAMSLLESTKALDIFSHVKPNRTAGNSLPSFVPDWRAGSSGDRGSLVRYRLLGAYNASLDTEAIFRAEPGVLYIRGRILDHVQSVASGPLLNPLTEMSDVKVLDEMLELACKPQKNNHVGEREREKFWVVMCGGVLMKRHHLTAQSDRTPISEPISAFYERITSIPRHRYETHERFLRSLADGKLKSYARSVDEFGDRQMEVVVNDANNSRKGMITGKGSFGLVPIDSRVGDFVAVLTGGRVPVILRPEAGYYTLVGDAYVHGIMDGEAMQDLKELEWIELH